MNRLGKGPHVDLAQKGSSPSSLRMKGALLVSGNF
jgi:hypothetical protein